MSGYASGSRALGLCDVCGFTYKLNELRRVFVQGSYIGIKSCPECWDPDHPQNFQGSQPVFDPQALRDPRPDTNELAAVRALVYPVTSLHALTDVGQVTISVT